jgi:copper chaperone CopZ
MMKSKIFLIVAVLFLGALSLNAQEKKEEFKVYGNCGMCESRIEKAAQGVEGVSEADWNKETKMINVSFDKSETGAEKIHEAIADAGHDTKKVKAKKETYDNLPGCCKYDRTGLKKEMKSKEGHHHE